MPPGQLKTGSRLTHHICACTELAITESQKTAEQTVLAVMARLGYADVRAMLVRAGVDPNGPALNCDASLIAKVLAPLFFSHSHQSFGSLLPNLGRVCDDWLPAEALSTRAQNVLARAGLRTVGDLAAVTPLRLIEARSSGKITVTEFAVLAIRLHLESEASLGNSSALLPLDRILVTVPFGDAAVEAPHAAVAERTLLQCFSTLELQKVQSLLTDAGISPSASVADCDPHKVATVLSILIVARSDLPLGLLLPGLTFAANHSLPTAELSVRAQNVLSRNGIFTNGLFGAHSLDAIKALGGAGATTILEYARLAARLHMQAPPTLPISEAPPPPTPKLTAVLDRITEIAAWASTTYQTATFGDLFALAIAPSTLPPDVMASLADLRRIPLLRCIVPDADANGCIEALWAKLEERERDIFVARQLSHDRPTLEELGRRYGVARERIRQIEGSTCEFLRTELAISAQAPLQWRLHALASVIRNGLPESATLLKSALESASRGLTLLPMMQELLLWLAGPYSLRDGWVLRQGCKVPVVPIDDSRFEGDEVLPQAVADWLDSAGFQSELVGTVMAHSELRLRNGKWLRWGGSQMEKAEVILRALGRPADTIELAHEIDDGTSERSLRNRIFTDPRFVRVNKREVGLREWGLEEYSGIAAEIAERLERAGGALDLELLVSELVQSFGVAPSSVRLYAEAPRFAISNGTVRIRQVGEEFPLDSRIHATFGLFPEPARQRVHLVVKIDADVERGSGVGLRQAVGCAISLTPGQCIHFDDDCGGRLRITWPDSCALGPSLGSIRAMAKAAGAVAGESLLITFDLAAHRVCAHRICPTTSDIGVLTGLEIAQERELYAIAASIGCNPIEVRTVLANRGDLQLLNALPIPQADADLEAALSTLIEKLRDP